MVIRVNPHLAVQNYKSNNKPAFKGPAVTEALKLAKASTIQPGKITSTTGRVFHEIRKGLVSSEEKIALETAAKKATGWSKKFLNGFVNALNGKSIPMSN